MDKIKVLSCAKEGNFFKAEIENSPFYIDGKGGQLGDRGNINGAKILNVVDEHFVIVNKELTPGTYFYFIDEARRVDIAIQHTAQHLFSAIAYNDYELNTVGFRMSDNYSTVDLDSQDLSPRTIEELEDKINEFIGKGSHVLINILPKNEAAELKSLRKKISEKVQDSVRIIEIEGIDTSACAGFHVENIKELRLFKIIKWEKIKGSYTRFYFLSGQRAIDDYKNRNKIINTLVAKYSCKDFEILAMTDKVLEEKKKIEGELRLLSQDYGTIILDNLYKNPILLEDKKVLFFQGNHRVIEYISSNMDKNEHVFIGLFDNGGIVTSHLIDCGAFVKFLTVLNSNIRGGGSKERANIKGDLDKTFILCALEKFFTL
ncbi:alanyl-tRNA synthetase [Cetobacterium ceti]|uniref:Alanyl-tRNA synthetase n=1 Tax=Cetobacterium ceti TaxID=180163 RepID=A0A1T4NKQ0_9FUSO|nr:alanyl-tRNA editing protein [Cetobacterium ceti]SJZ79358.1 alanyl-tRNA synthetase [Cetobacterium ceti]